MAITIDADDGISAARREEVRLPGPTKDADYEVFDFVVPRVGPLIGLARRAREMSLDEFGIENTTRTLEWLADGFGPEAWAHIEQRMQRPAREDLLDEEHMVFLFGKINEGFTGRPPTSSSGASRQPWKRPSTAAPSQVGSDSGS